MRKVGVSPEPEIGAESHPEAELVTTSQLRYKSGERNENNKNVIDVLTSAKDWTENVTSRY